MAATSWPNIYPLGFLAKVAEDYPWRKMTHPKALDWAMNLTHEDYLKYVPQHEELINLSGDYRHALLTRGSLADIQQELNQLAAVENLIKQHRGYNSQGIEVYYPTRAIYDPGTPATATDPGRPRRMHQGAFRLHLLGFEEMPGGGLSPERYRAQLISRRNGMLREQQRRANINPNDYRYGTPGGVNHITDYNGRPVAPSTIPPTPPVQPMTPGRKVGEILDNIGNARSEFVHWVLSGQCIPDMANGVVQTVGGGIKGTRDAWNSFWESPAGQTVKHTYADTVPVEKANEHFRQETQRTNWGKNDLTGVDPFMM